MTYRELTVLVHRTTTLTTITCSSHFNLWFLVGFFFIPLKATCYWKNSVPDFRLMTELVDIHGKWLQNGFIVERFPKELMFLLPLKRHASSHLSKLLEDNEMCAWNYLLMSYAEGTALSRYLGTFSIIIFHLSIEWLVASWIYVLRKLTYDSTE